MSVLAGRTAAVALCGAVLSSLTPFSAQAATFEPVNQTRAVFIAADVNITNLDPPYGGQGAANDSATTLAGDFSDWVGDVNLYGRALGDVGLAGGRTLQRSSLGPERISFYAYTDIQVSLISSGDIVTGGGSAYTYLHYSFDLTRDTVVQVDVQSVPGWQGNDFQFGLYGPGNTVIAVSPEVQGDGSTVYGFSRSFALTAGRYDVGGTLSNLFALDGGGGGPVEAMFSVTAVPEPEAVAMWAGGLAVLAGFARRRRGVRGLARGGKAAAS